MQNGGQWEPGASLLDPGLAPKQEKEATMIHGNGQELEARRQIYLHRSVERVQKQQNPVEQGDTTHPDIGFFYYLMIKKKKKGFLTYVDDHRMGAGNKVNLEHKT